MERGGVDETGSETVLRRLRTIPPRVLGLVFVTVLLPALLVTGVGIDAVRRVVSGTRPTAVRLVLCLCVYLVA